MVGEGDTLVEREHLREVRRKPGMSLGTHGPAWRGGPLGRDRQRFKDQQDGWCSWSRGREGRREEMVRRQQGSCALEGNLPLSTAFIQQPPEVGLLWSVF